ncbi:hypothetical protein R1sor_025222 [Riccia sorocarpa]|uniref:DUF4371 domain-containing protein n=1 Tax=Riccia sorocarpa TaxID=122646 RepID=A0ABD3GDP4_9MARC
MQFIGTCTTDIPHRLYRDDKACVDFIYYISQVIQVEVLERVRASSFWGLMIDEYIHEWGLDPNKLVGFGSDGASTMLGSKNRVVVRLKRDLNPFLTITHCVAHRTNLASSTAAKESNCKVVSDEVDTILNSVSSYFAHSSKRKAGLHSLQVPSLSDARKSMKRFCKIRWLSRSQAVCTLCDSLESVMVYFKSVVGRKMSLEH